MRLFIAGFALLLALSSCTCATTEQVLPRPLGPLVTTSREPPIVRAEPRAGAPALFVDVGDNVAPAVRDRLLTHLRAVSSLPVVEGAPVVDAFANEPALGSLAIGVGDSAVTRLIIPAAQLIDLPPEGYALRSGTLPSGVQAIVADGFDRGAAYGAYAIMEELGFAFLHPLAPTRPADVDFAAFERAIDRRSAPRWPIRNWHLHTMHPLELTEVLQGWPVDDRVAWDAMLPEWDAFLEWLVANGQNEVEWVLLEAASWAEFAQSDERRARLTVLVERAHAFGVRAGVDVPIALIQQHTFRLVRDEGELFDEFAQIHERVDWLMSAGFDFISTENGSTEFTHPDPNRMLAWMSELARYLDEEWDGRDARIKIHCSTGQAADGFVDEETSEPLNFNFLPHYADPRLGVMPHTVQHYGLDDPAPTYGNTDFEYIREFLRDEAGTRTTLFHPETAYWVSFDVDVPLFLPLYAERRLADLQLLAADEVGGAAPMDGQSVFSSGWEWGYWLNDVVAARAAWSPEGDFRAALAPVSRALDPARTGNGDAIADLIVTIARDQRAMLIEGRTSASAPAPADVVRMNGQAYLQGFEAFDDLTDAADDWLPVDAPNTQPDRLGLVEMNNPFHAAPAYSSELDPLLAAMDDTFATQAATLDALVANVPTEARDLADDLADSMRITALRARQIHGLYDYADGYWSLSIDERRPRLDDARAALDEAMQIVQQREQRYRVPADRIAAWRENPTAYEFTYLWTARTLYFWWRDEGKAVDGPISPCYQNIINPGDVGLGEGGLVDAARLLRDLGEAGFTSDLTDCLAEPSTEPLFPQDELRARP